MKKKLKDPRDLSLNDLVRYFDDFGWELHIQLCPVKKATVKTPKKRAVKRS
jgi:hypothetical protein